MRSSIATETPALTPAIASAFARLALAHVEREYPNKLDHWLATFGMLALTA